MRSKISGRITAWRRVSSISGTARVIEKQPLSAGKTPYLMKPMSPAPGGPPRGGSSCPGRSRQWRV